MVARTMVGAQVICYVNGSPFGRIQGFTFSSATPRRAIYGIDQLDPQELAPTQTKVSGLMRIIRTIGDGGAEGAGITATYEDLAREKYFTLQLVDRSTDTVIFQARYCSVMDQDWQFDTQATVKGAIKFEALEWSNEVKPLSGVVTLQG